MEISGGKKKTRTKAIPAGQKWINRRRAFSHFWQQNNNNGQKALGSDSVWEQQCHFHSHWTHSCHTHTHTHTSTHKYQHKHTHKHSHTNFVITQNCLANISSYFEAIFSQFLGNFYSQKTHKLLLHLLFETKNSIKN